MMYKCVFLFLFILFSFNGYLCAQTNLIQEVIEEEYESLESLYKHLHENPELSLQEKNTSQTIAGELKNLGFEVTENVGGYGVVAQLKNGDGPVVLVRSDMDALPIKEETGVPFASNYQATLADNEETYVMHACGHDMHMAVMIGTAKTLTQLKEEWAGTLIFIAQPAEEAGLGAKAMIDDGLFDRFPRPDYALALHVNSAMESGKVGIAPGYSYANVDNLNIVVNGRGGHGAYPDLTVDPIVIASRLVLDLQTIISREVPALESAVLSVGSIQGGNSSNVIPNEVELKLTLRTFSDEIRNKIIRRIDEVSVAAGQAAALPEEEWPEITYKNDPMRSVYNDPDLSEKAENIFKDVLGPENVSQISPVMYGEDFGWYGRIEPRIPILLYSLGSVDPEIMEEVEEGERDSFPSTHSSKYLPDIKPTLQTGILSMSSAVIGLMPDE